MRNVYIAVAIMSIVVIAAVIYGFVSEGSPFLRQAIKTDSTRISNFNTIKYNIETYYARNQKLPENLSLLSGSSPIKDPKTKQPYDYFVLSETSYKLCANFSSDSSDAAGKNNYNYLYFLDIKPAQAQFSIPAETSNTHKKGYDCLTYEISSYLKKSPPVITTPPPTLIDNTPKVTAALANIASVPDIFIDPKANGGLRQGVQNTIMYVYDPSNGVMYLVNDKNQALGNVNESTSCNYQLKQCQLTWNAQSVDVISNNTYTSMAVSPGKYYFVLTNTKDQSKLVGKSSVFSIIK